MRGGIRDVYWFNSPLYTLRALAWNLRTLGFPWWLYCLALNTCAVMRERLGSLRQAGAAPRLQLRPVRSRNR
jgi:hypothetical protein